MKIVSRGYHTASEGITLSPWERIDLPVQEPLQNSILDWDCSTKLRVGCKIGIDRAQVLKSTSLGPESVVRVVAGWYCERTRSRTVEWSRDLGLDQPLVESLSIEFDVPGERVAVSTRLETKLILVRRRKKGDALAARLPGTVLWHNDFELALEPDATRFPIEWVDFGTSIYPENAAWVVDWVPEDLARATHGALRLLMNRTHPTLSGLLEDEHAPTTRLLWQVIFLDVARQLVRGALGDDDFTANPDMFEWESLGGTVYRMISNAFVGESMASLRSLLRVDPKQFEARLQAKFGFLEVVE